jgi:diguanylate cyclase (GGDEF)-like protein
MADVTPGRDREESTISVERIVGYVRRVAGDAGVAELEERSGLAHRWAAVTHPGGWCGVDDVLAVAAAASQLCHDPDIGRRTGEEHFRDQVAGGVAAFLRQTGSIRDALTLAGEFANRISTIRSIWLQGVGPGWAEAEMVTLDQRFVAPAHRFFCGVAAGYLAQVPSLFDTAGAVVERTCQHLGADRCRFRLVWDQPADRSGALDRPVPADTIERFEQLQAMAAELTRPEEVDVILERLVAGVGANVSAERTALVVQLPGERRRRTHSLGFDVDADALADQVLDGGLGARPEAISIPIASTRHDYGWVVAVLRPGAVPADHERRMLVAYASHAAAALDGAVTLAEARRSQAAAEGLLDLAGALTSATDIDAIAHHLVRATTVVTGADQAVVLFSDVDEGAITARASIPEDAIYATLSLPRAAIPELTGEDSLLPRRVDVAGANPVMAAIMEAASTTHAVTVPIAAHGTYLGTLVAGYSAVEPPEFDQAFVGRMRGLADQAAAAVQNVRLLEQIRHQALHDSLTGLPNRPLMEDRAQQAIVQAARSGSSVGLLFLDLDRFKEVNDTLGHAVGDELLQAVANRLTDVVRSSDTVARQGGDEFLILLPNPPDLTAAEHTARKVLGALVAPFTVAGRELAVSASIGVAWCRGDASYQELVRQADVAMYQAKEAGRNGVAVYRDDPRPEASGEG